MTRVATEAAETATAEHAALAASLAGAIADYEEQVAGLDDCMRQVHFRPPPPPSAPPLPPVYVLQSAVWRSKL